MRVTSFEDFSEPQQRSFKKNLCLMPEVGWGFYYLMDEIGSNAPTQQ